MSLVWNNFQRLYYAFIKLWVLKMLKIPADLQRVSITATCIEAFSFFTSDLLLWTELKFYLPKSVLDSVVSSKQLLIHCICISYLHK